MVVRLSLVRSKLVVSLSVLVMDLIFHCTNLMPSTSSPTLVFHRIFVSSNEAKSKENNSYNRITPLFIEKEEQGIGLSLKTVDPPP